MGLLTQILGGLAGNALRGRDGQRTGGGMSPVLMALLPVVLNMLSQRSRQGGGAASDVGGIGDLIGQLTQKGYGRQAGSWIATGANEALPPQAIDEVFGHDQLRHIAQQAGLGEDEARSGLSELLPDVVDHFTPDGNLPEGDQLSASVDDYLRRLT
ncbi:YidB family protein [Variovorax sp. J22R115]|uniref:YidB family protein n=1 Tax=Variovorax sp. J22R115 TaxID=3053509 RepID=UPI002575F466|nr:YidB family protein [Variovorax sp. J22R115]MDM0049705.1 YidB family protein [Variovorax sp. J22R115]